MVCVDELHASQPRTSRRYAILGQLRSRGQWCAAVAVTTFYLAAVTPLWCVTSDSALYLMLGENLAAGNGYTLFGQPHAFVPPGYPLIVAAFTKVGLGDMLWLNLGMVCMGLLTLWFSRQVIRAHASAKLALVAVLVLALNSVMYRHSVRQLSDVPFMLLVFAGLACYTRGRRRGFGWMLTGSLLLVASCWVRLPGIAIAIPAALGVLLESSPGGRRRAWLNAGVVVAGVGISMGLFYAWHQRARHTTPSSLEATSTAGDPASAEAAGAADPLHSSSYAPSLVGVLRRPWWDWIAEPAANAWHTGRQLARLLIGQTLPSALGLLIFGVPILAGMRHQVRRRRYLAVVVTLGYVGAIVVQRPMVSRYLLPVAPLLLLFYLDGARRHLATWLGQRRRVFSFALVCALLLVGFNLPRDLKFIYYLRGSDFAAFRAEWIPLHETASVLQAHARPQERFLAAGPSHRVLSYLSGVPFVDLVGPLARATGSHHDRLGMLDAYGVRFVVTGQGEKYSRLPETVSEIVSAESEFQLVFENSWHRVYRRVDP